MRSGEETMTSYQDDIVELQARVAVIGSYVQTLRWQVHEASVASGRLEDNSLHLIEHYLDKLHGQVSELERLTVHFPRPDAAIEADITDRRLPPSPRGTGQASF